MSTKNPETNKGKKAESKYDAATLRNLIKTGKTAKEIMDVMGIGHKQILKHHVLKLCASDHTYYDVPGLYGQNTRKAYVNSRGEIKIKEKMVDFNGLVLEPDKTEFDVEVVDNKIILTVITPHRTQVGDKGEPNPTVVIGDDDTTVQLSL